MSDLDHAFMLLKVVEAAHTHGTCPNIRALAIAQLKEMEVAAAEEVKKMNEEAAAKAAEEAQAKAEAEAARQAEIEAANAAAGAPPDEGPDTLGEQPKTTLRRLSKEPA